MFAVEKSYGYGNSMRGYKGDDGVLQDGQISRLLDGGTSALQAEVVNDYRTNFKR